MRQICIACSVVSLDVEVCSCGNVVWSVYSVCPVVCLCLCTLRCGPKLKLRCQVEAALPSYSMHRDGRGTCAVVTDPAGAPAYV